MDLKDKSELLFRGTKLGTIVVHVKEGEDDDDGIGAQETYG